MIRIAYISRINLLSDRANAYNLTKTCEAINAREGFSAKLITTDQSRSYEAFYKMMGVKRPFPITCLNITNTLSKNSGKRWFEYLSFALGNIAVALYLSVYTKEFDVVYFRDESLAPAGWWARRILKKKMFFEIHSVLQSSKRQKLNLLAVKSANGVVAISSGLERYYEKLNPKIMVSLCSAAEEDWFDYARDKKSFREELGLPQDVFIAGYTGVVGANPNNDYYELDDIVKSLPDLPPDIVLVIVGELTTEARWLREIAEKAGVKDRVTFLPWQDRGRIPKYLQAFDCILVPKRKKDYVGDSPAKMFQALASQRPIIAGRTECIEEVYTNGKNAIIIETNTPQGWASAIRRLYKDPILAEKLSTEAWIAKAKYTWDKRGIVIGDFIKGLKN